mgnify:FL=1
MRMSSKNSKFFVMAASLAKQLFAPEFFDLNFDKLQGALLHYEAVKLTKALLHIKKAPLLFPSNDTAELLKFMAEHAYCTGNNFCDCYCSKSELWEMVQNKDDYDWFKTVVPDGSADEILERWANLIAGYVVSRHDFPKSRKDLYVAVLTKDIETFGMACMSAFFCCSFLKTMKLHE